MNARAPPRDAGGVRGAHDGQMSVDHETMRNEIDRLRRFFPVRGDDPRLDHVAYALEDLPEKVRAQARMIMAVPPGGSFAKKVVEVTIDAAADLYGTLEKVKRLHFLSQYPVTPYTYLIDDHVSRGSRPSQAKLAALARDAYTATVNLCAEMEGGDAPQISRAGLAASLNTHHIPITDGTTPRLGQVTDLLGILAGPGAGRAYLHCEAGRARTGVMTACYRMAVMGWRPRDALMEARNFGCSIPDQLHFIEEFGAKLAQGDLETTGYPRQPLGSHAPTAAERSATRATAAADGG
jgi:Tyrosine phosphatase family